MGPAQAERARTYYLQWVQGKTVERLEARVQGGVEGSS